jgi:hypothetical protein
MSEASLSNAFFFIDKEVYAGEGPQLPVSDLQSLNQLEPLRAIRHTQRMTAKPL